MLLTLRRKYDNAVGQLFKGAADGVPIFGRWSPTIFVLLNKSKRLLLQARRLGAAGRAESAGGCSVTIQYQPLTTRLQLMICTPLGGSYKDALIKWANHRNWAAVQLFQPLLPAPAGG